MATILISAAPHDAPTKYGYFYLRKAADVLAKRGHKVIFLRSATLENFRRTIAEYNPQLVIINGHGGSRAVTGRNNEVILGILGYDPELGKNIIRENPHWMSGRMVFLFTCNTGRELAPHLYTESALAVAAFKMDYIFVSENSTPTSDRRAYPFFMAPIQLPLTMAEGGTFQEGVEAIRNAFSFYYEQAELAGDVEQAKYLNYNLENLVAYGDGRL